MIDACASADTAVEAIMIALEAPRDALYGDGGPAGVADALDVGAWILENEDTMHPAPAGLPVPLPLAPRVLRRHVWRIMTALERGQAGRQ